MGDKSGFSLDPKFPWSKFCLCAWFLFCFVLFAFLHGTKITGLFVQWERDPAHRPHHPNTVPPPCGGKKDKKGIPSQDTVSKPSISDLVPQGVDLVMIRQLLGDTSQRRMEEVSGAWNSMVQQVCHSC